jgi:hypothetical protein
MSSKEAVKKKKDGNLDGDEIKVVDSELGVDKKVSDQPPSDEKKPYVEGAKPLDGKDGDAIIQNTVTTEGDAATQMIGRQGFAEVSSVKISNPMLETRNGTDFIIGVLGYSGERHVPKLWKLIEVESKVEKRKSFLMEYAIQLETSGTTREFFDSRFRTFIKQFCPLYWHVLAKPNKQSHAERIGARWITRKAMAFSDMAIPDIIPYVNDAVLNDIQNAETAADILVERDTWRRPVVGEADRLALTRAMLSIDADVLIDKTSRDVFQANLNQFEDYLDGMRGNPASAFDYSLKREYADYLRPMLQGRPMTSGIVAESTENQNTNLTPIIMMSIDMTADQILEKNVNFQKVFTKAMRDLVHNQSILTIRSISQATNDIIMKASVSFTSAYDPGSIAGFTTEGVFKVYKLLLHAGINRFARVRLDFPFTEEVNLAMLRCCIMMCFLPTWMFDGQSNVAARAYAIWHFFIGDGNNRAQGDKQHFYNIHDRSSVGQFVSHYVNRYRAIGISGAMAELRVRIFEGPRNDNDTNNLALFLLNGVNDPMSVNTDAAWMLPSGGTSAPPYASKFGYLTGEQGMRASWSPLFARYEAPISLLHIESQQIHSPEVERFSPQYARFHNAIHDPKFLTTLNHLYGSLRENPVKSSLHPSAIKQFHETMRKMMTRIPDMIKMAVVVERSWYNLGYMFVAPPEPILKSSLNSPNVGRDAKLRYGNTRSTFYNEDDRITLITELKVGDISSYALAGTPSFETIVLVPQAEIGASDALARSLTLFSIMYQWLKSSYGDQSVIMGGQSPLTIEMLPPGLKYDALAHKVVTRQYVLDQAADMTKSLLDGSLISDVSAPWGSIFKTWYDSVVAVDYEEYVHPSFMADIPFLTTKLNRLWDSYLMMERYMGLVPSVAYARDAVIHSTTLKGSEGLLVEKVFEPRVTPDTIANIIQFEGYGVGEDDFDAGSLRAIALRKPQHLYQFLTQRLTTNNYVLLDATPARISRKLRFTLDQLDLELPFNVDIPSIKVDSKTGAIEFPQSVTVLKGDVSLGSITTYLQPRVPLGMIPVPFTAGVFKQWFAPYRISYNWPIIRSITDLAEGVVVDNGDQVSLWHPMTFLNFDLTLASLDSLVMVKITH